MVCGSNDKYRSAYHYVTDFLKPGTKYIVNLYEDDDKLNTRTKVRTTHKKIKAGDKLTLKLKSSGGAALHFTLAE